MRSGLTTGAYAAAARRRTDSGSAAGFTLLELLVAMSILVMIVMMMSTVFFQSRATWDAGLRRSRLNMQGRAIMDFLSGELSQAILDPMLDGSIGNGPQIRFFVPDTTSPSNRAVMEVAYAHINSSNALTRTVRKVVFGSYPDLAAASETAVLAHNVSRIAFSIPDSAPNPCRTNLPSWVGIDIDMLFMDDAVRVRAGSGGVAGWDDDTDNIWSE